eukprot:c21199_g1_i1 orf=1-405(-)
MADDRQEEVVQEVKEDVGELAPFDPTKKKKKKKFLSQDPEEPVESVDVLSEKVENLSVMDSIDSTFAGKKKKKKKQVEGDLQEEENGDAIHDENDLQVGDGEEGEGIVLRAQYPWDGTNRDYFYEELLGRVFNIL